MGTTAQKGEYLNETKQELKQAINNLGGDITSQTTFRNYVSQLENVYDNLPKTSFQEGTSVTIENGLKGKIDFDTDNGKKIVGYGDTEQESYEGYNLIDITSGTIVSSIVGITTSISGDILTINGSRNDGSTTNAKAIINDILKFGTLTSGETYKIFLNIISGRYTGSIAIAFANSNNSQIEYIQTTNGNYYANRTLTFNENVAKLRIAFNGNFTANNLKVQIMLQKGTTEQVYEPYVGNSPSPNPSYPQDIEVVRGRNLFNDELEVGGFDGEGLNSGGNVRLRSKGYTQIESNTNYTINAKNNTSKTLNVSISYYTANDFVTHRTGYLSFTTLPYTFSIPSGCKYIRVLFKYTDESSMNIENVSNVMLEQGSQATSYLPYNTIEVKARGKNHLLCRIDIPIGYTRTDNGITWQRTGENTFKLNGTASGNFSLVIGTTTPLMENLKTGETYTLSGCPSGGSYSTYRLQIFNYSGVNTAYDTGSGATFVPNIVSTSNVAIRVFDGVTINNLEFNVQIELGSTKTSFIPFEVTTKQLSLGEYEFAKIGNYVDTIEYDVENDKVYKNEKIKKKSITDIIGSKTVTYNSTYSQFVITQNPLPDLANNSSYANQGYAPAFLCNSYKASTFSNALTSTGYFVSYLYVDAENNRQLRFKNEDITDVNTFISSIANDYLVYPLEQATLTEITDTTLINQVKALYNAHSNNGTTIIESNGDLPLIIKIRALKGE